MRKLGLKAADLRALEPTTLGSRSPAGANARWPVPPRPFVHEGELGFSRNAHCLLTPNDPDDLLASGCIKRRFGGLPEDPAGLVSVLPGGSAGSLLQIRCAPDRFKSRPDSRR